MNKLLIILFFLPSIAFAEINYADNILRDCKGLESVEKMKEMSQKEINKCHFSMILRNMKMLQGHDQDIEQLYSIL